MTVGERIGQFLLRNNLQAGLAALVLGLPAVVGVPMVAWLGMIIIGFITLRRGSVSGFLVLIWSAIPALALCLLGRPDLFFEQILAGALVLWIFAVILRHSESWSLVLECAAWLGIIAVLLAHVYFGDLYTFWANHLNAMLVQVNQTRSDPIVLTQKAVFYVTHLATGFAAAGVMINALFNLIIARWWQASLFNPGGFKQEFLNIRIHYRLMVALVICVILLALKFNLLLDLLPAIGAAFFISGLSLMHFQFSRLKRMWLWIIIFYVLLVFQFMVIASLLVILSVLDSLFDARKRLNHR